LIENTGHRAKTTGRNPTEDAVWEKKSNAVGENQDDIGCIQK
jgi:hypothetical protein